MTAIPLATITITRYLDEDGYDMVTVEVEPDEAALVEQLGLLRLAEDSIIRDAMGEGEEDE